MYPWLTVYIQLLTRDLHTLADWQQQCGVRSIAMESTSVYWIPIYQILDSRGRSCSCGEVPRPNDLYEQL
jgi:hypothetical protein